MRAIIHEGSIDTKYNIEYFGVKNNVKKILSIIETELFRHQNNYNTLIENGPFV